MDGKESNILKMDQKKRISISKIDKIFKVNSLLTCNYTSHFPLATTWTCNQHCVQSACKYYQVCYKQTSNKWTLMGPGNVVTFENILYVFDFCHN